MWRVVRLTLMWLLAVAVPMQGLSAATMLACGVGQHEHSIEQVASHSHAGVVSTGHHQDRVADSGLNDAAAADGAHLGKADLNKGGAHKCSACASCCVSAVLASDTISFDPVKLTDSFAAPVARTLAAFVPDGFERPPRLFLA
jgi:hypothetical protein